MTSQKPFTRREFLKLAGIGGVIMVEGRKELLAPSGMVKAAPALGRLVTVTQPQRTVRIVGGETNYG